MSPLAHDRPISPAPPSARLVELTPPGSRAGRPSANPKEHIMTHPDDFGDITMSAVTLADRLVAAIDIDPLLADRIGSGPADALLAYRIDSTEDGACRVAAVLIRATRTDTLLPTRLPSGVLAALADYQAMTGQAVAS